MADIIVGGSLKPNAQNIPTRAGELINSIEEIMSIPNPRVGMEVWISDEGKAVRVLSLKEKEISGVVVPNAMVDEWEYVVDKGDEAELLLRLQGDSENSCATTDPFVNLGNMRGIGELVAYAETIIDNNGGEVDTALLTAMIAGVYRAFVNGSMYEMKLNVLVLHNVLTQTITGVLSLTDGVLSVGTTDVITVERYFQNGNGWSEWKIVASAEKLKDLGGYIIAEVTRATNAETELLARVQGTSESSNPRTDPFKYLGSFSGINGDDLKAALDALHTTKASDNIEGLYRATLTYAVLEIQCIAMHYATDRWMQVLKSPYRWVKSTGRFDILTEPRYRILYRIFENPNGENSTENNVWSDWHDVEQDLEDAILAEKNRATEAESNLKAELNEARTAFTVQDWEPGYYIHSSSGKAVRTAKPSAVTDFIEINGAQSIEVQGRALGGLVALLAFYDADKVFISSISSTTNPYIVNSIPNNAAYVRATGNNDENDRLVGYANIANVLEKIETVQSEVDELNELKFKSNILLTGASFAYSGNQWPTLLSKKLGIMCYNKAVSGTSILHTARLMYENTLYTAEELENFDILMIMHVHNVDVFNTTGEELMENYENYEDAIFFPKEYSNNKPANMSYAQAYDYVLKKYAADCYALKDKTTSKWYGLQMGKPFNVVCLTHWHDARTLFNNSIRLLEGKWGFTLIELDREIGFTKELTHPVTKEQVSLLYAIDTENINGVSYGWHPDRREVNGEPPIIQQRIAEIVADSLLRPQSQRGIVEMEKGRVLAKRDLFIAAGALYNDTDAAVERTAPWGERVQHLPGHYYLNGLGDITEEQMTKIYNRGCFNDNDKAPLGYGANYPIRTNLCRKGMWNANLDGGYFAYSTAAETLNLHITTANTMKTTCTLSLVNSGQFVGNAPNLRIIDPRALLSATTWDATAFAQCPKLEEVRLKVLRSNVILKDSPALSKASVMYMIQKAKPTTAITITLHADAYARLESDTDIVAALEAQPLITLVSA